MRILLGCLCLVFAFVGCRSKPTPFETLPAATPETKPARNGRTSTPTTSDPVITIGPSRGRVASVNPAGRFVVLRFPVGVMPAVDRRLGIYREGLKVGELRVSGPQYDNNTVADIIAGDCRVGDEAREE